MHLWHGVRLATIREGIGKMITGVWILWVAMAFVVLPIIIGILWTVWGARVIYLPGYWKIIVVMPDYEFKVFLVRIKTGQKTFNIMKGNYKVPQYAGKLGRWRLPIAQYRFNVKEPIRFDTMSPDIGVVSATEHQDIAKQTLAKAVFDSVTPAIFGESFFQLMMLGGMLIGFAGTIFYLSGEIKKVAKLVGG